LLLLYYVGSYFALPWMSPVCCSLLFLSIYDYDIISFYPISYPPTLSLQQALLSASQLLLRYFEKAH
jgi:hypothetical protein